MVFILESRDVKAKAVKDIKSWKEVDAKIVPSLSKLEVGGVNPKFRETRRSL